MHSDNSSFEQKNITDRERQTNMKPKKIILDTDIGPDCDDAAAIAMLNLYADDGLCEILGIGHCTSNPYGAGTIDAICRYYGRPQLPIGTFKGEGFLSDAACMKYNRVLTETLPNRYRDSQPEDVIKLYRRILSAQEDKSVDMIAIGPLNNMAALLASPGDEFSPLSGRELIQTKARRLVAMAGSFPCADEQLRDRVKKETGTAFNELKEYNVFCDIPAAQRVADAWPTEIVFLGFEAGLLETGKPLQASKAETHPVKMAYKLYTEDGDRFSWDLLTVEYAVNPSCGHFRLTSPGRVSFDHEGRTLWTETADGRMHFVEWAVPEKIIVSDINTLLQREPQNSGN